MGPLFESSVGSSATCAAFDSHARAPSLSPILHPHPEMFRSHAVFRSYAISRSYAIFAHNMSHIHFWHWKKRQYNALSSFVLNVHRYSPSIHPHFMGKAFCKDADVDGLSALRVCLGYAWGMLGVCLPKPSPFAHVEAIAPGMLAQAPRLCYRLTLSFHRLCLTLWFTRPGSQRLSVF